VISISVEAVPFALTTLTHTPAVAFLLQVISGAGMIVVDVLAITALQRDLDRGVLSRVLGVFDASILAATAGASFVWAAVFSSQGLDTSLIAIGVFFPAMALLGLPTLIRGDRKTAERARQLAPIVELLSSLDLFSGASRNVLEGLAAEAEEVRPKARSIVIREGDPADALYILAEGSLTIRAKGAETSSKQLPSVDAPGYVGELGLIRQVPRTATVRAREDCRLLKIPGDRFLAAMEAAPASSTFLSLTGARWARTAPARSRKSTTQRPARKRAATS
jgi:CRP-like cAMP-binding protein